MDWDHNLLKSLPSKGGVIMAEDERMESYREDTMYRGSPDAVVVARDEQEVTEVISFCNNNSIPVTVCGSQTSMTGASVPNGGLLVSTERLEGVIDIVDDDEGPVATVRPGTIVADLQGAIADAGYFYPVAPTSRDECRIGSNVSTNATGEDSYKYGPVRQYVKEIDLILPNGAKKTLRRNAGENPSWERNRAGYFTGWKNPIDLIIGSEGTLGFISRVALSLIPKAPLFFSGLIPFPSNGKALDFVLEISIGDTEIKPRTLELIDSGALKMMKTADGFPKISDEIAAFLYIKQEYANDEDRDRWLSMWYDKMIPFAGQAFADRILIALTPRQQEDFRLWRHRIPEAANEHGHTYWKDGGSKVGSDWWVPLGRLRDMMEHFYMAADATGLPYMGYAHIGAGHPHTNFLAKNPAEKKRALDALASCCKKAVDLGGGVAGEHGIGKIHTDLLAVQHPREVIEKMRRWKREYDPNWIMGRGNIFGT